MGRFGRRDFPISFQSLSGDHTPSCFFFVPVAPCSECRGRVSVQFSEILHTEAPGYHSAPDGLVAQSLSVVLPAVEPIRAGIILIRTSLESGATGPALETVAMENTVLHSQPLHQEHTFLALRTLLHSHCPSLAVAALVSGPTHYTTPI